MSKQNFDKFINKEVKGAKKKEQIKQEKKQVKKEREAFFIEKKREQRAIKKLQEEQYNREAYNRKKLGAQKTEASGKGKPVIIKKDEKEIAGKSFTKKEFKPRQNDTRQKPASKTTSDPKRTFDPKKRPVKNAEQSFDQKRSFEKPGRQNQAPGSVQKKHTERESKIIAEAPVKPVRKAAEETKFEPKRPRIKKIGQDSEKKSSFGKPSGPKQAPGPIQNKTTERESKIVVEGPVKPTRQVTEEADLMPLNKYIAHAGICSRRDAGELVKQGKVTVNGEPVTDPGTKVTEEDVIKLNGKKIFLQHNLVYILLNKPKDYITTAEDPQGRKTVLDIVRGATPERIFPVGRLDRNTSGVLLLTNDGELAQQLTHPSFEVRKIYEAKLDKPLTKADFTKLMNGVTLEDGFVQADSVAYADSKDKSIIGIEIHSGRNRVVRRMFEHLGYDVKALDRVMFANLTKKNVDRGRWRFLTEKEVRLLKYFKSSQR